MFARHLIILGGGKLKQHLLRKNNRMTKTALLKYSALTGHVYVRIKKLHMQTSIGVDLSFNGKQFQMIEPLMSLLCRIEEEGLKVS